VIVIDTTICQGQTLTVNGMTYSANGNYFDTITHVISGCDSIQYDITLHIDSFEVIVIDTTICQGQTLTVNGTTYTNAVNNALDTAFYTVSGCDSIQYDITLHIDSFEIIVIDTALCQGQTLTVNGTTYSSTGHYFDTITHVISGCDSIQYDITLLINPTFNDTLNTSICANDTYTLPDASIVNSAGTYHFIDTSISGCDSLYTIVLSINALPTAAITQNICIGDSAFLAGAWQNSPGVYIDTLSNGVNCDSILTTTLVVNALPNVTAIASASTLCQGDALTLNGNGANTYTWTNGVINNTAFNPGVGSQTYIVTGTDANNCIDTASVLVLVNPTYSATQNVAICESNLPYTFPDGTTHNVTTDISHTSSFNTINGCDSLIITQLSINQNGTIGVLPDTVAVCESFNVELFIASTFMQSFQWQLDNGVGFTNLTDTGIYSGSTTNTLIISPLNVNLTGNRYRVIAIDECGNGGYMAETYLRVSEPHDVINPIADIEKCLNDSSLIFIDYNGFNYVWNDGQTGPYLVVNETGTYTVTFTENGTNCAMEDDINVTVEDCIENCIVIAPTGFSPNASSGKNDIFKVITNCEEGFSFYELRVYNRWGEMVYTTTDPTKGWDGIYKNQDAEIGTYVYLLNYVKEGKNKQETLKGQVTLIR
jgi:gliding motility-associated-like protein